MGPATWASRTRGGTAGRAGGRRTTPAGAGRERGGWGRRCRCWGKGVDAHHMRHRRATLATPGPKWFWGVPLIMRSKVARAPCPSSPATTIPPPSPARPTPSQGYSALARLFAPQKQARPPPPHLLTKPPLAKRWCGTKLCHLGLCGVLGDPGLDFGGELVSVLAPGTVERRVDAFRPCGLDPRQEVLLRERGSRPWIMVVSFKKVDLFERAQATRCGKVARGATGYVPWTGRASGRPTAARTTAWPLSPPQGRYTKTPYRHKWYSEWQ